MKNVLFYNTFKPYSDIKIKNKKTQTVPFLRLLLVFSFKMGCSLTATGQLIDFLKLTKYIIV